MGRERAALARNILIFFAGLGAAGLLIAVLNTPAENLLATGQDLSRTSQAAQGHAYVSAFWDALPFLIAILAFVQLIGAAAAERRVQP